MTHAIILPFPHPSLAPTSVGVSTERMSSGVAPIPVAVARALRADRSRQATAHTVVVNVQPSALPPSSSLAVTGAPHLVAVSTESGMRVWRVLHGFGAGNSSVRRERRMRTFAVMSSQKGVFDMAYPTPRTLRVVERQIEFKARLRHLFLVDGSISTDEQSLLDEAGGILSDAEEADEGRKTAISMLNMGELTPWQQRKWRERHKTSIYPEAA